MGKENADADQAQNRCDCFIHGKCPLRFLFGQDACDVAQSKGIPAQIENRT
jgi:hypothetical protein